MNTKTMRKLVVIYIHLSFLFLVLCNSLAFKNYIPTNQNLINRLLPQNYDPLLPPTLDGGPVNVEIAVSLLNIRAIKETELSYTVDIFYHQYWSDYRLIPQNLTNDQRIVLPHDWRDKLWIPDSYFKNALSGHVTDIIFPTLYFAIHNQTNIFMATRVSLQLSCVMSFAKFPHDTQECFIDIMSLSHTIKTVVLSWKAFTVTSNLHLAQFWLYDYSNHTCHKTYTIDYSFKGKFSCLRASIKLKRELGLYIVNKYIPSTLIVVMSFVGFWIPVTAYPARVALVITALLALITQQHQSSEVNVSYVIALNVWMITCITFVFFALIEYAIAIAFEERRLLEENKTSNRLSSSNESNWNNNCSTNRENQANNTTGDNADDNAVKCIKLKWFNRFTHSDQYNFSRSSSTTPSSKQSTTRTTINKIDTSSRVIFPIAFVTCIFMYLIYLYLL